jgi:hypothetical protein
MATKTAEVRPITAWIPIRDLERLTEAARENDRSVSAELRIAVRKYLALRADDTASGEAA